MFLGRDALLYSSTEPILTVAIRALVNRRPRLEGPHDFIERAIQNRGVGGMELKQVSYNMQRSVV